MALNLGAMRHVVRIEQRSPAQDPTGDQVLSWSPFVGPRRAEIVSTPGREFFNSAERQGRIPTIFKLRYLDGVTPAMRLIHSTGGVEAVFKILSAIDPDHLRVELVITCEELVGEEP